MGKPELVYHIEENPYYRDNPVMFGRLVKLLSEYPFSYGQMLRAKGKKQYVKKHPDYVPPYRDLYEWILASTPKLADPFYKISTKCHWILNGLTDFPVCAHEGCNEKLERANVEVNQGYYTFCIAHSKCDPSTGAKKKAKFLENYGVDHPMKVKAIMDRRDMTNISRYSNKTPLAVKEYQEKGRITKRNRYGDENWNNREKCRQTKFARYGDPFWNNPEKATETSMELHGVPHWTNHEQAVATRLENHNGEFWTDEMTAKSNATIDRHRSEDPDYDKKKAEKTKATTRANYGVDCYLQSDQAKSDLQAWIDKHGGGTNAFQTEYVKEKSKVTMKDRLGVEYAMQSPEVKAKHDFKESIRKGLDTKRKNGTFNASKPEDDTYDLLVKKFGADDVERQYSTDSRYPFRCDFYVKSLDLFIECNYTWLHGGHWYDSSSQDDAARLEEIKHKAKLKKTENPDKGNLYENMIETWTARDPAKRAAGAGLNYLVFWNFSEAEEWCAAVSS